MSKMRKVVNIRYLILGMLISGIMFGTGTYAATVISGNNISYVDNANLGVNNVQAAIDGTCTKFSSQLTNLKNDVISQIYPIGSIYISTSISTVSELEKTLGVGTWESYATGRTLIGAGSNGMTSYSANTTGGKETTSVTLTTANLPSHAHTYDKSSSTTGSHILTIAEMPSHNHVVQFAFAGNSGAGSVITVPGYPSTNKSGQYEVGSVSNTGGNSGHTHSISLSSASTGTVGSSKAININNVQPYVTVYMYKRTK